uniref:Iron-binding zinc finger CDGSH type domain-containing protein n=1 Tax=Periophthalmus magnuspinnatus TaxID=409849 RepID=A0A3B4AJ74_9GOBI
MCIILWQFYCMRSCSIPIITHSIWFCRYSAISSPQTSLLLPLCTYPPEPVIPVKKPFKVDVVGGKWYSWCTCGYSKKQPFCDGAHKLKAPSFTPLRFVPDKDMTIYLCGCKYTNNPPYCDGTHKLQLTVFCIKVPSPLHLI